MILPEIVYYNHQRQKLTMTSITLRLANIRNYGRQHKFNTAFTGLIGNKMMGKCQKGHSEDRNESVPCTGNFHLINFYLTKMIYLLR